MAPYKLYIDPFAAHKGSTIPTHVVRVADMAHIPMDADNTDYQAYLAWVAQGNTPDPAEES